MATSSRPPDVDPPTIEAFLKSIMRSGLLDREQLQAILVEAPPQERNNSKALAEFLIKKGKLSRFQASKLLKGTAKGLILGDYQILAPLGKGGMGTVYMARDQRSGRLVALKVLPPARARAEERTRARFQREMELSRRLEHPMIALTYETGLVRDVYYIAMEYLPGKTLYRVVTEEGTFSLARAAHLGLEIAIGLNYAHQQGLIHRDLKPSNIIVTPNGHAKILDFGLAIMAGEKGEATILGGQGYIVGSMDYISPEQTYDASKVDGRADIYSLGCTLYFALTGLGPFHGGTSTEKIHKQRHDLPPPLLLLRPDLPMEFVDLVHKMMAKQPELRFPTAREVGEALHVWTTGQVTKPLDKPEDTAFLQSVQAIQTADAPSDLVQAELPPVEDSDSELTVTRVPEGTPQSYRPRDPSVNERRRQQAEIVQQLMVEKPNREKSFPERRRDAARLQYLLLLGGITFGIGLLAGLVLTCILALLLRK